MKKRYLMLGIIIVCLAVNSSVKTLYAADAIYDLINNLVYDAIFLAELEEYDGENMVLEHVKVLYDKQEKYKDEELQRLKLACLEENGEIVSDAEGTYVLIPAVLRDGKMRGSITTSFIVTSDEVDNLEVSKLLRGYEVSGEDGALIQYYLKNNCEPFEYYKSENVIKDKKNDEVIFVDNNQQSMSESLERETAPANIKEKAQSDVEDTSYDKIEMAMMSGVMVVMVVAGLVVIRWLKKSKV